MVLLQKYLHTTGTFSKDVDIIFLHSVTSKSEWIFSLFFGIIVKGKSSYHGNVVMLCTFPYNCLVSVF